MHVPDRKLYRHSTDLMLPTVVVLGRTLKLVFPGTL
jgi:hypothetical protein